MTRTRDLQTLGGFGELRARYVAAGLQIGCAVYGVRAIEPGAMPATRGIRVGMVLLCFAALRWLPRSKDQGLTLARAMLTLATLVVLVIAWTDAPRGFPFGFLLIPGIALAATLFGGSRFGTGVAVAGGAASFALFAFYPGGGRPPLLTAHVTNFCTVLVVTQAFGLGLASNLRQGAADLARSTEVLQEVRQATRQLSQDLSQRVAGALRELESALPLGDEAVGRAAAATAALLLECRAAVPPEPELVETRLEARMATLSSRLAVWSFRLGVLGAVANTLRNILLPPAHIPAAIVPVSVGTATVLALLALAQHVRPAWSRSLYFAFNAIGVAVVGAFTALWLHRQPGLPPNLAFWSLLSLMGTAVLGLQVGLSDLVLGTVIVLVGAWPYAALSWAIPLNYALWYGLICWVVWRMPRDLIAELSARHFEAAAEIRTRRRLVATLFHDLATPLTIVQMSGEFLALGEGEPDDRARVREMVGRMKSILGAAVGGTSPLGVMEAGQLFDAMEALYRERLAAKSLELSTSGPRQARVRGREVELTESVLGNLLSNAIKFSPAGGAIDLGVREEHDAVSILVQDRGPGLPEDVKAALAKGLTSVSRPGTAGEKGHGYGLMLAQDLVREMGGTLEFGEREGGGLVARVRLERATTS